MRKLFKSIYPMIGPDSACVDAAEWQVDVTEVNDNIVDGALPDVVC